MTTKVKEKPFIFIFLNNLLGSIVDKKIDSFDQENDDPVLDKMMGLFYFEGIRMNKNTIIDLRNLKIQNSIKSDEQDKRTNQLIHSTLKKYLVKKEKISEEDKLLITKDYRLDKYYLYSLLAGTKEIDQELIDMHEIPVGRYPFKKMEVLEFLKEINEELDSNVELQTIIGEYSDKKKEDFNELIYYDFLEKEIKNGESSLKEEKEREKKKSNDEDERRLNDVDQMEKKIYYLF